MVKEVEIDCILELIKNLKTSLNDLKLLYSSHKEIGCVDGGIIGTGQADYTKDSTIYNLQMNSKNFSLIDVPGIEGNESQYKNIIKSALEQAHLVFYVSSDSKKIEKKSLDKIKKYMHDGTSVYALFNLHCKPKKNRIIGKDKATYSEELLDAYKKQQEIVRQTESQFRDFLGNNFRGSICLNGLLAFCSLAINKNGITTIINDSNKNLRNDQNKYINEYSNNLELMLLESHISSINDILKQNIDNFDNVIKKENYKKLHNRMHEMLIKISTLRIVESKKINNYLTLWNEYQNNINNAKEDFIIEINDVSNGIVYESFESLLTTIFEHIEKNDGKIVTDEINRIVEKNKDTIINNIQNKVNNKIKLAILNFEESYKSAQKRFRKELDFQHMQFEIELSAENITIDDGYEQLLKYDLGDFGKHAFTIGGLAFSGAEIGTIFNPIIGTIIGASIGTILGIISSIWNFFISKKDKINKAKTYVKNEIDTQIDNIINKLNEEIGKMKYENSINNICDSDCKFAENQKRELKKIIKLLNCVSSEFTNSYNSIIHD